MQAWAGVFEHPFHGVTGKTGSVATRLPPGKYEVEAWHRTLGSSTQTVEVAENGQASLLFAFKGVAATAGGGPDKAAPAGESFTP